VRRGGRKHGKTKDAAKVEEDWALHSRKIPETPEEETALELAVISYRLHHLEDDMKLIRKGVLTILVAVIVSNFIGCNGAQDKSNPNAPDTLAHEQGSGEGGQ